MIITIIIIIVIISEHLFWQQCFHRPSEVVTYSEPVYYCIYTVSQRILYIYIRFLILYYT